MANFNKVFLMGNMTRDPELRYTPSGTPVCEFGLAVNRRYTTSAGEQREETCFVDVSMWGRRGVVVSEYFTKGKPIFVEGRLKYDSWDSADGRRSKLTVVAEDFQFMDRRGGNSATDDSAGRRPSSGQRSQSAARGPAPKEKPEDGFDVSEDEIPF